MIRFSFRWSFFFECAVFTFWSTCPALYPSCHSVCPLTLGQSVFFVFFFFQAEDGIRDVAVTGVQTCALPISFNLLAVIAGYSELMLRRLRPNDPLRSNAESIKKTTEWGIALAQQILMTSRDPGPALIAVNQVVANVAKVLQPAVGDQITLVTRLDPGVGRVAVNHGQLGQVIMNLVVNARDAMPQGGRLTIETLNAGSDIVLVVSDTGVGM